MSSKLDPKTAKTLRLWLYGVALLIAAMVLVGGATRLTESGLSITEWKPVSGALPPLSEIQWQDAFQKYQTTTEYSEINRGMSLDDFKTIYWWEWAHRFLGRFIGLAFALPFLFFALTKNLPRPLLLKLGGILCLGGLQGAIGWWMVVSGLAGRVDVAPYRLAVHLTLALFIFTCILSVAFSLKSIPHLTSPFSRGRNSDALPPISLPQKGGGSGWGLTLSNKGWGSILLLLLFLQIFLGGLVAGTRAGYAYNTWPLMDGGFVPSGLFILEPWWRNFFENTATVQFLHRVTAYLLLGIATFNLFTKRSKRAALLFCIVVAQAGLGIATLLSEMNLAFALAHQAGIIVVLFAIITNLHFSVYRSEKIT